ncbi:hypothetical protein H4Q26_000463 [Puccinia striiformis f. sp. tritici PST-130]|nr:hypothetical protein H4Q26_000463 [Puccinia striiformis f. sp. tritici PST-130]
MARRGTQSEWFATLSSPIGTSASTHFPTHIKTQDGCRNIRDEPHDQHNRITILTLPPLAIPSPARASKSPVSRFSSSTSAHSDSSEKGPDDLIASLRSDLKNAMKTKNLVQRDVIKEVELLKKYLTFFSSNHSNQNLNEEALMKTVHDCISKLGLSPDATLQERQNSLGKLIKSVKDNVDSAVDGKDIANSVRKALELP